MWKRPHWHPAGMTTYSVLAHEGVSATNETSTEKAEPGNGKKDPECRGGISFQPIREQPA